jgi:hypothetical protein
MCLNYANDFGLSNQFMVEGSDKCLGVIVTCFPWWALPNSKTILFYFGLYC